jgi:group I intron endonuclease
MTVNEDSENNHSVYWIKRIDCTDIYSEGYVGISKNVKRRFNDHKRSKNRHSIVHNSILKYEDIEIINVHENLSLEEAKTIEEKYRPKECIGWNLAKGGGVPPSMKGIKRPEHAKRMAGENNPFFGKTHTEETKRILRSAKIGDNNPFYKKNRPDHSDKMKLLKGNAYPKFKGYFITPIGTYDSYKDACDECKLSPTSLYNYCIIYNEKQISKLSFQKKHLS